MKVLILGRGFINFMDSLNPKTLEEFIGKDEVIKALKIGLKVLKNTGKRLDHVLLYGPPGVGKTSLAVVLANEMKVSIKVVQGANLQNIADMMGVLSTLKSKDVLFIDEIHSVKQEIAEILYPALENKMMDVIVGKGIQKRSIRVPLPEFTLIAATTNLGDITKALEERFGYIFFLDTYTPEELEKIVKRACTKLDLPMEREDTVKIVESCRGVPRNLIRIMKRLKDYHLAGEKERVEKVIMECGFIHKGLSSVDIKYLQALKEIKHSSLTSLSYQINVDERTIVRKIEPYLFSKYWISKSNKGRSLTEEGLKVLKEAEEIISKS